MGGKKKLSLKQMERMQARRKGAEPHRSIGSVTKKETAGVFPPDPKSEKIIGELKKMKVLTPYTTASRLGLRLSAAKHFLDELEQKGTIEYVSGSKSLKIYKIAD